VAIAGVSSPDLIGNALWWQPAENDTHWAYAPDGSVYNTMRPVLPDLAPNATPADQALYAQLQALYANPDLGPQFLDQVRFGSLAPGRLPAGQRYTDPNLLTFLQAQNTNANLTDQFSPWGDEFFTALAGLGLATGAAGAYGGFAAAPAAEGVSAGAAAGLEGEGALFGSTLGPATTVGGEVLASPLPATFGAESVAGATGDAGSFAGPVVEGAGGAAGPAVSVGGSGALDLAPLAAGPSLAPAAGSFAPEAASTGILGTGLTAAQLVKLAPLVATAGSALATAVGGSGSGTTTGGGDPANEALFERLRQLAAGSIPERLPGIIDTQRALTERANASPQDLMSDLRGQIQALRGQLQQRFHAAGTAMGPQGGRQAEKAQGQVLASAGNQLGDWVKQATAPAGTNLTNFLSGVRPAVSTALPQPVTTVLPPDFSSVATGIKGAGQLYRSNWFDATPTQNPNQDPQPILF
jgi:hypothetical protein